MYARELGGPVIWTVDGTICFVLKNILLWFCKAAGLQEEVCVCVWQECVCSFLAGSEKEHFDFLYFTTMEYEL